MRSAVPCFVGGVNHYSSGETRGSGDSRLGPSSPRRVCDRTGDKATARQVAIRSRRSAVMSARPHFALPSAECTRQKSQISIEPIVRGETRI